MDKIKGEGGGGFSWGGVEGWGEKAYNCNWITIKIFKKRRDKETNEVDCRERKQINVLKIILYILSGISQFSGENMDGGTEKNWD